MSAMTKRVNVRATVAVRNTNPPIYGTYKNIIMTTGDILKCLTKRATVDEILPDGSTIRLNYKNYYTDNGAGLDAKGEIKVIKPKQPPVKKAAPVEPEKPTADISFNDAPMSNIDTKEIVEKQVEISAVETAETHAEPIVLITEDDSKEDTIVTDDETPAEEVTKTENAVDEQPEASITGTIETPAEPVKVKSNSAEPVEEHTPGLNDTKEDNAEGKAPKVAPTAKKKSTTSKKKK